MRELSPKFDLMLLFEVSLRSGRCWAQWTGIKLALWGHHLLRALSNGLTTGSIHKLHSRCQSWLVLLSCSRWALSASEMLSAGLAITWHVISLPWHSQHLSLPLDIHSFRNFSEKDKKRRGNCFQLVVCKLVSVLVPFVLTWLAHGIRYLVKHVWMLLWKYFFRWD